MHEREPARKLTTILSADAAEYSRMMRADEEGTFRALRLCREAIDRLVDEHEGRVFGSAGDGVVAEFASPVEALRCAADIQQAIDDIDQGLPEESRMKFRIGVNLGDVLVQGADLIGDGVNVADRIQGFASPGEICISASVHEIIRGKPEFVCEDLGPVSVKNISDPIHVYRVLRVAGSREPKAAAGHRTTRQGRAVPRFALWAVVAAGAAIAALGLAVYAGYLDLEPPATSAPIRDASIAVLPFQNLSGDAAQDYFADGITEDLITDLAQLPGLLVSSRNSTFVYKGSAARPRQQHRCCAR